MSEWDVQCMCFSFYYFWHDDWSEDVFQTVMSLKWWGQYWRKWKKLHFSLNFGRESWKKRVVTGKYFWPPPPEKTGKKSQIKNFRCFSPPQMMLWIHYWFQTIANHFIIQLFFHRHWGLGQEITKLRYLDRLEKVIFNLHWWLLVKWLINKKCIG